MPLSRTVIFYRARHDAASMRMWYRYRPKHEATNRLYRSIVFAQATWSALEASSYRDTSTRHHSPHISYHIWRLCIRTTLLESRFSRKISIFAWRELLWLLPQGCLVYGREEEYRRRAEWPRLKISFRRLPLGLKVSRIWITIIIITMR